MLGFLHTNATHHPNPEDEIYAYEHIAYDYVFITPSRSPIMRVAEAAMRAGQRINTEAAKRSYIHSTEFLFPLYAMESGDSNYIRVLRPEMLGLDTPIIVKRYDKHLHGRRWYNQPWCDILSYLKSFLHADYWLDRHQLRALMQVRNDILMRWLKRAVAEHAIEKRTVNIYRGGDTPQYRLWAA